MANALISRVEELAASLDKSTLRQLDCAQELEHVKVKGTEHG